MLAFLSKDQCQKIELKLLKKKLKSLNKIFKWVKENKFKNMKAKKLVLKLIRIMAD